MRILLPALAFAALLLSGCSGGGDDGGQLSDAAAREAARQAMEDFVEGFTTGEGSFRTITGEFAVSDEALGNADVDFEMERGRGDVVRVKMQVGGSGLAFDVELYCSSTVEVMVIADQAYTSRPAAEGSCLGTGLTDDGPLDVETLEDADISDVEAHPDGSVTARIENETGEFTMEVDAQGRLTQIEMESDQGSGTFDIEYGELRAIDVPEDAQRVPAEVEYLTEASGDGVTWTVVSSPQLPPLSDFHMRFEEDGQVVASVPLSNGLTADGDYAFGFEDTDDDGKVSEGDVFTFTAPAGSTATPVLYDTWAEANVGDNPVPGLGLLGALGALAAACVLLRRRA